MSLESSPEPRDPPGLLGGAVAAGALGLMVSFALPLLVGALMDGLALDATRAGLLSSLELGAMAAAQLGLAPRMHRISRRFLALSAASLMALASAASGLATSVVLIFGLRMIAGACAGALVAASMASIAASVAPDRLYARAFVVGGIASSLLLPVLALATDAWQHRGGYLGLALITLLVLPWLRGLPGRPVVDSGPGAGPPRLRPGPVLALAAAGVLLATSQGAIWAFSERIGLATGMAAAVLGLALGAANLAGLVGAAGAERLGVSRGRTGPLAVGVVVVGVSCWLIPRVGAPSAFVAAQLGFAAAYFFSVPFLLGLAAALDGTGRLSTAFGAATTAGGAAGPVVGGWLVVGSSYVPLGWLALGCALAALAMIAPLARRLDGRPISSTAVP